MVADELFDRLRAARERVGEAEKSRREAVELVGQLRSLGFGFEVIRDRGGVPLGTAHRWATQYQAQTTNGEEQG